MLAIMSQRQVDPFLNLNSGAFTLSDICLFIQFDGARIYMSGVSFVQFLPVI